jgi:predicted AAA+ superfamily ATPase
MSFLEFLDAIGEYRLCDTINSLDYPLISALSAKLIELLKYYFFVGGMPEAVLSFSEDKNLETVRDIQKEILRNYQSDFSKHIAGSDIPKVGLIWNSIPAQLAKDNSKFLYKEVKQGARAREYENAVRWIINSGLVHQVNRISKPNLPLISYQEREHFKLYMVDIGLLGAMAGLDIRTITQPNTDLFNHFKGALAEQFVLQELKNADEDLPIFYWANDRNTAEVDFIIQKCDEALPIEVKAEKNLKSKSLKTFINTNKTKTAIRSSLANYGKSRIIYDIPMYMISKLTDVLKKDKEEEIF